MSIWRALILLGAVATGPAQALEIDLPANAQETVSRNSALDVYAMPTGAFDGRIVPVLNIEGEVRRSVFRVGIGGLTPLQVTQPLRAQLEADGYEIVLDCKDVTCGGFDFRFATEVLPAPDMQVNLRSFQFVSAVQGSADAPERTVTLLASISGAVAYLQIIQAGNLGDTPDQFNRVAQSPRPPTKEEPAQEDTTPDAAVPTDLATGLQETGHAVLSDIEFDRGGANLSSNGSPSLEALAAFLRDNPDTRIALVGHTDSTGALDVNTRISRQRAEAVLALLVAEYQIERSRLEAHGVGFLAPHRSNATDAGREANRRVEAVLLP
jgi:OOP family OmpA-OmpF porin